MSELKKVYVVTRGKYSDRGNFGVYTTRELAEAAGGDVEEWILDNDPQRSDHLKHFEVAMNPDGNVLKVQHDHYYGTPTKPHPVGQKYLPGKNADFSKAYWFHVFGKDITHAIKVANENRIQMLAENLWK